jgi:chromosome partitioning protein
MGIIYTLANQKGGVGKTTTTINLGAYLAEAGKRVLLVDIDSQANATSSLGIDKNNIQGGIYETLLRTVIEPGYILYNSRLKLWVLPSSPALAGAEIELVNLDSREHRLKKSLAAVTTKFDYILIDCPPSLGLLTLNGLTAAKDGIIIPVQCEYLALEGLGQLTYTLDRIRSNIFPDLKVRGVIMTMFDSRTNLANDVVEEVKKFFPGLVFNAVIPRSVRLAEAPSYGVPISIYDPGSSGARSYQALAHEILEMDNQRPTDSPMKQIL